MIKTGQVYRLIKNTKVRFYVGAIKSDQIMETKNPTITWIRPQDLLAYYTLDVLGTFKELIKRNT